MVPFSFVQGLNRGLGAELVGGDCGSTVSAKRCGGIDGAAARRAVRGCSDWFAIGSGGANDLTGNVDRLGAVVQADAVWHKEAFDNAEDCGDAGPKKDEVDDACGVSPEIEVVDAECAKEEREQDANHLVFAGTFVFGIEPGALVVVHMCGVERVGELHDFAPRNE